MKGKQVAVLDIRSGEVSIAVGERDVNRTFSFRAAKTEPYSGYEGGVFYDKDAFEQAVVKALSSVEQTCGDNITRLYVGVPGDFVSVLPKTQDVGFTSEKKFTQRNLNRLIEAGREERAGFRLIRAAGMKFVTSDNRLVLNPVGLRVSGVSGLISYFYCTDYFVQTLEAIFSKMSVSLSFIPSEYAQCIYLIRPETRDECAIFLDVGFISSTVCTVLGNGIIMQESYPVGRGTLIGRIMQRFSLPLEVAESFCSRINLFVKGDIPDMEIKNYAVPVKPFLEEVLAGLDDICEPISAFLERNAGEEFYNKPVYVTGEGLSDVRGSAEHLTKRLNRVVEYVSPDIPYSGKTSAASRLALADMAYEDNLKRGFLYLIVNGKGGF